MKIYWYWPHPHRDDHPLARAVIRPGDSLVVEALSSYAGEPLAGEHSYPLIRDLPDPAPGGRWTRLLAPARAVQRVRRRRMMCGEHDILHIETITYEVDAFDLPRLARRQPVVVVVHDVEPHVSRLPRGLQGWLHRRVYGCDADFVVYHEQLARRLVEEYGVPASRVHTLPNALEPQMHATRPGGDPTVLLFGSLRANKGVDVLLQALLSIDSPGFCCTVAGTGDAMVERSLSLAAVADPRLKLELGRVSERRKWQLYAASSCVVLPYTSFNSQSAVLADAYAARRPVVVSDIGVLGETVRADGTGVVVPPSDAAALARGIAEVLGSPAERFQVALDLAAERHSHKVVGKGLRDVYEHAVTRRSR